MAITIKRQISEDEKATVLRQHGRVCFATGHIIPEGEKVHFDHIRAFAAGGKSDVNNIAPMCEKHNKEKGTLSLKDFRIKLQMGVFFKGGDALTLQHELEFLQKRGDIGAYGETVSISVAEDGLSVNVGFNDGKVSSYGLHVCEITKWRYFYAVLPVSVINSDDDSDKEVGLQPRYLIRDKVFNLFRHFQNHPVLQPSLCRIRDGKVLTFDGQHKIAAILWNGQTEFECKVYVDCDARLLNETNMSAHDKYAQTRFFSSVMVVKLGRQFGADFDSYKNEEDGNSKSEQGFFEYLQKRHGYTDGVVSKQFRSWLYNQVLESGDNKMAQYVAKANRRTAGTPITMDVLGKSIFTFMYRYPVDDDITTDFYLREEEVANMVQICNMLVEEALHEWNAEKDGGSKQINLKRVFGSKPMMAWAELLKDAICAKLDITDSDERNCFLYRQRFDESSASAVRQIVRRLVSWNAWDSPFNSDVDRILANNKSQVKEFLKAKGLTTGYLMGAPE